MEDVPRPALEPYKPGDIVEVYVAPDDPDAEWHETRCRVLKVIRDDLTDETGRSLDSSLYRVENVDSRKRVPTDFRHNDLVPADEV